MGLAGFTNHLFANVLSAYLTVAAIALSLGGSALLAARLRLWAIGERAIGEVVEHRARIARRTGETPQYVPVVKFQAAGVQYRFQSRTGRNPGRLPVGSKVEVLYAPGRPSHAELAARLWIAPAALFLFAALLLAGAAKAAG